MPTCITSKCIRNIPPNHEAYLLIWRIIERAGMRKADFLARLADYGHCISDNTFTNWGRPGRAFPRDWTLLRAMLQVVSGPHLTHRCSAAEALRFCYLTGLPFSELHALSQLFPVTEFEQALVPYLPMSLAERIVGC